jgi:hypothetical protein
MSPRCHFIRARIFTFEPHFPNAINASSNRGYLQGLRQFFIGNPETLANNSANELGGAVDAPKKGLFILLAQAERSRVIRREQEISSIDGHVAERHIGQARNALALPLDHHVLANGQIRCDVCRLAYSGFAIAVQVVKLALLTCVRGKADDGDRHARFVRGEVRPFEAGVREADVGAAFENFRPQDRNDAALADGVGADESRIRWRGLRVGGGFHEPAANIVNLFGRNATRIKHRSQISLLLFGLRLATFVGGLPQI